MKKLLVVTLALSFAGIAFASSLSVPWFIDTGPAANKLPPVTGGVTGLVYLNNGSPAGSDPLVCSIEYFTQDGISVGPAAPNNTFEIAPKASIAFRPVASDPASVAGGQEAELAGWLVPDRPGDGTGTADALYPAEGSNDNKKNGSLVVTWVGESTLVGGIYSQMQYVGGGENIGKLTSIAHLLPSGA